MNKKTNKLLLAVVFVFSLMLLLMVFELKKAALVILLPLLLLAAVTYLGYALILAFYKEDKHAEKKEVQSIKPEGKKSND